MPGFVLVVTEGLLEIPATQKILGSLAIGHGETRFVPKGGREAFWRDVTRYNRAAPNAGPILGLADLEQVACAGELFTKHLPDGRNEAFILRIAVRMLESWLIADRQAIADFLRVSVARVPKDPDSLINPKQELVNLARRSPNRQIVADLVPPKGSSGTVGRGYSTRMTQFIRDFWRPAAAGANSASLRRALAAIQFIERQ